MKKILLTSLFCLFAGALIASAASKVIASPVSSRSVPRSLQEVKALLVNKTWKAWSYMGDAPDELTEAEVSYTENRYKLKSRHVNESKIFEIVERNGAFFIVVDTENDTPIDFLKKWDVSADEIVELTSKTLVTRSYMPQYDSDPILMVSLYVSGDGKSKDFDKKTNEAHLNSMAYFTTSEIARAKLFDEALRGGAIKDFKGNPLRYVQPSELANP